MSEARLAFDFELPDIFADYVSRLRTRQAVKNCYDRLGVLSGHRVQNFGSEALSGQVGRIGEECFIDRSQCQLRPVLRQQHLASAPAENAVFRKPSQAEGAKKVSAFRVSFKPRVRDVQQRVIGQEN